MSGIVRKTGDPLVQSIDILRIEGYTISDKYVLILELINSKSVTGKDHRVEFDILHGLGTHGDIIGWLKRVNVSLFPLGSWSIHTIFLGDNDSLYLTDFDRIAQLNGKLKNGFDSLMDGVKSKNTASHHKLMY